MRELDAKKGRGGGLRSLGVSGSSSGTDSPRGVSGVGGEGTAGGTSLVGRGLGRRLDQVEDEGEDDDL